MADWHPTAYRTHTLGEIQDKGADLVGTEVTVCGFMEANRGKGAICFVDLATVLESSKSSSRAIRSERKTSISYRE